MSMNGIDISKWQGDIDLFKVPSDFVIIKATQANNYINPYFIKKTEEALKLNKLVGVYHYIASGVGAEKEAEFFLNTVRPYLGKVILVGDWESDSNPKFGDYTYVLKFLDTIYDHTKIRPLIYQSKSVCRTTGMDQIASKYKLWCAQYANNNTQNGYRETPWTDSKGFGPWNKPTIYQYTSNGKLDGYNGKLDLNKAYITKDEWTNMCKAENINNVSNMHVSKVYTVTANSLNIRETSDKSSNIIGVLKNGSKVKVDNIENGMAHFSGWCSMNYLK